MGGETSVQPDSSNTALPKPFTHLRLNNKWECDVADVSAGGRKIRQSVKKTSPSAVARLEPYPKDFLSSIEKLSLKAEDCRKQSCKCSVLRLKSKKPFNYANSSVQHRPVIREAKLKLHHSQKDTKQLIRAARLKIFKTGTKSESIHTKPNLSFSDSTSPSKIDSHIPVTVFGAKSGGKCESLDFQSLVPAQKPVDDDPDSCETFQVYRTHGAKRRREQIVETERLRNSYSDCGREMRQSEGARLDETSDFELAAYFDEFVHIPKKMSTMAEMMYT